ncbi:hypothetical protein N0V82_007639 [Gnomoniopsis sp. IMI 355080]|nr:hypothetical protein N0V82_007639 [Gnomoniopsis sp. IMI 355080]
MFSSTLKFLLATGLLASVSLAIPRSPPAFKALSKNDLDTALAPLPGVRFNRPGSKSGKSISEKRAKDRFQVTEHWTTLHAYKGHRSGHMSASNTLGSVHRKHGSSGYENITSTSAYGTQYGVEVQFNKQKLSLALDTGSSDTWAVSSKANCTGYFTSCFFGPSYAGGFNEKPLVDEHLYIQYGDGEVVQGPIGFMDVTVGGIQVTNQTVALANDTFWNGNNVTSGILGLAYPSITNAYSGPFGEHSPWYQMEYSPIFSNMVAQGLVNNYFSIAISRNAPDGVLGLGGVPEHLAGVDFSTLAMTDIIIANLVDDDSTSSDYSFYTIIPDGWLFGTSTDDRKVPYIIDTGTTLTYLPQELSDAINNAFEPPAIYDFMFGSYFTSCDAVPPRVAVVIDDTQLWLNPEDLMLNQLRNPLTGLCMTTISSGGSGPYILGDVFLQNVLAVFDVDDGVMQFASRENY